MAGLPSGTSSGVGEGVAAGSREGVGAGVFCAGVLTGSWGAWGGVPPPSQRKARPPPSTRQARQSSTAAARGIFLFMGETTWVAPGSISTYWAPLKRLTTSPRRRRPAITSSSWSMVWLRTLRGARRRRAGRR